MAEKESNKKTDAADVENKENKEDEEESRSSMKAQELKHGKPVSEEVEVLGAVNRQRSQSQESNTSSCDGDGKRLRTNSQSPSRGFVIPGISASPPKFVSLEEIMKAANGVTNMALAHEIAVDKDFKLTKIDPPENSIYKQVQDVVHKAFWDVLAAELAEDPPNYSQAMVLLTEIKENLLSLLLPQHSRLKQQIDESLDIDLIKQQAEAGTLDFQHYAQYIISVLAKLCAPVRDEKIRELMQVTEVVSVFRGILETLDLMKLDMANFTIQQIRPHIVAQSVEYEKKKFQEFLELQEDGLEVTREWLQRHKQDVDLSDMDKASKRVIINRILTDGYMELLEWDDHNWFPETLVMDEGKFLQLRGRTQQVIIVSSVLLVTFSTAGAPVQSIPGFKDNVKEHVGVIMSEAEGQAEIEKALINVSVQVEKELQECLQKHGFSRLDPAACKTLSTSIKEIAQADHRIRQLVRARVMEFLRTVISSSTASPIKIPPGLSSMQRQLAQIAGTFMRLVSHNRAVFGEYYYDIIEKHCLIPQ